MKNRNKWQFVIALIMSSLIMGCQSSHQRTAQKAFKIQVLEDNLKRDKQNVDAEALRIIGLKEWQLFKDESELNLIYKELNLVELKNNIIIAPIRDTIFENNINIIKQRCSDMKTKIRIYGENPSNLQAFKRRFNYDLEQLDFDFNNLNTFKKNY